MKPGDRFRVKHLDVYGFGATFDKQYLADQKTVLTVSSLGERVGDGGLYVYARRREHEICFRFLLSEIIPVYPCAVCDGVAFKEGDAILIVYKFGNNYICQTCKEKL